MLDIVNATVMNSNMCRPRLDETRLGCLMKMSTWWSHLVQVYAQRLWNLTA